MTIPNLLVSLNGIFEFGQAYVALSRATSLKTLTLADFSVKAIRAHPKVKNFYKSLAPKLTTEQVKMMMMSRMIIMMMMMIMMTMMIFRKRFCCC
jgi:ABC-type Na+ efflux pump permease subunit